LRSRIGKVAQSGGEELLTCEEVITFLREYLDQELEAGEAHEFERHLARCRSCVAYLETYRETIRLARGAVWQELSGALPELDEGLVRAILAVRER